MYNFIKTQSTNKQYKDFFTENISITYWLELRNPVSTLLHPDEQVAAIFRDAYIRDCSEAAAMIFGFGNRENLIGKSLSVVFSKEGMNPGGSSHTVYKKFIRSGYRLFQSEVTVETQEGKTKFFCVNAQGFIKNERLVRILGSQIDISDLKNAYEVLQESELKFRTLFENAGCAIALAKDNTLQMVNQAFLSMFNCSSDTEVIGKEVFHVFAPEEKARLQEYALRRAKGEDAPTQYETRGIRADGTSFEMLVRISPYTFKGESYTLGVLQDISGTKRSVSIMKSTLEELEQLKNQLKNDNVYLQEEIRLDHDFTHIIGQSSPLQVMFQQIRQVAKTDTTVLILGETGTGKELAARAIHEFSDRNHRPLIKVNCSALPATLMESELFGHEKGAFTGAVKRQIGRFELAAGGTLFLDEIGEIPLELQAKLLRVLQEKEFERLGNGQTIKADVRVIAATNRNLEKSIKEGLFRQDLYYRINVFPITCPSLRDRKHDIPLLVKFFLEKNCRKHNKHITDVSQKTMQKLIDYHWPGNIRELENIIERAVIVSSGNLLHIADPLTGACEPDGEDCLDTLEEFEKKYILKVLEMSNWRVRGENGTAEKLGVKPTTLESKMARLGIKRT